MRRSYNRFSPPNAVFPGGRDLPLVRKAFGAAMRADRLVPTAVQRRLERRLIDLVDECTAGRYEASNRRLAELTGIELSRYGYALDHRGAVASLELVAEQLDLGGEELSHPFSLAVGIDVLVRPLVGSVARLGSRELPAVEATPKWSATEPSSSWSAS